MKFYDNTRLSAHRTCNRQYYWRHVLHITGIRTGVPLVFGGAWHAAMDAVWQSIANEGAQNDEAIGKGYAAFCEYWVGEGFALYDNASEDELARYKFRHDVTALEMLTNYVSSRRPYIEVMELLEIEKPFAVPLSPTEPDLFYVGRLDKVVRWDGRIWCIEHKTSSQYKREGYFKKQFLNSFSPNSQIDGYLHALHMEYGEAAKGVMVDAALVHNTVHEGFRFIPIERAIAALDSWLYEAHDEIGKLERNQIALRSINDPDTSFMSAFPKNTQMCQMYEGCPYQELCQFVSNPMTIDLPPEEFKVEKWEPFKELGLADIGLKPETE